MAWVAAYSAEVPKAGVYAVREGPVLAHNLVAQVTGTPLQTYVPQPDFLSLLVSGHNTAISSWKVGFAAFFLVFALFLLE